VVVVVRRKLCGVGLCNINTKLLDRQAALSLSLLHFGEGNKIGAVCYPHYLLLLCRQLQPAAPRSSLIARAICSEREPLFSILSLSLYVYVCVCVCI
jgi:hypothetical protein